MKKSILLIASLLVSFYFAQPSPGYYNAANGLTGAQLKTALSQIITNGHSDQGYNGLWTGYATTDRDYFYENDGTILDIYSENPAGNDPYNFSYGPSPSGNQCGNYQNEGDCYNREHIVPQSLFNDAAPMVNDIHSVRATDGKVNGMRSNFPFGVVGTASYTSGNGSKLGNSVSPGYSGTVFEPINAFKGDVARMIFYFVTRYESQLSGFQTGNMLGGSAFPGLQNWELQQLLIWNAQDPVSAEEISRNNASEMHQGNRNPFIDNSNYANQIWGTPDTTPPTTPTNLVASNPTTNSVELNWTASTDNIAVTSYEIYVDGVLYTTVPATPTSAVVSGLNPTTNYTFQIIAKDLAGNSSTASNTVSMMTLSVPASGSCGTEDFENVPAYNGYQTNTWTNNNITWTATDSRTDQTINNKTITVRNGALTSSTIGGGINSLTVTTQRKFSGGTGTFDVKINGTSVGTIPYSDVVTTTTISNINISGDIVITLDDKTSTSDRVAIDDLTWTCETLTTKEIQYKNIVEIYPNPVGEGFIFVKGKDLKSIKKAEIFTFEGRLIMTIDNPFKTSNKLNLKELQTGNYLLKIGENSTKLIIK